MPLTLKSSIVDRAARDRNTGRLRERGITLPTFGQLANPESIPAEIQDALKTVDPDAPHPLNLFRVHWFNASGGGAARPVPELVVLPPALTGVDAKIVVLLGNRFPMIHAHKVLAAYACLVPRIVSGEFDLTKHRAVWPSTGNFCRGGVAISRIAGCRGVAVLPEGMSDERFRWLEKWTTDPRDIVRTPGTESNVKEIYDACAALARDPANVIFNQFREYANYLVHRRCTGPAIGRAYESLAAEDASLRLRAFVSATGSAGTIAAGDYLKETYGSVTVAAEALECPTMLDNGYGDHRIQGIGDKHIPLIHNVMNTDVVVGVSDRSTDALNVLFNSPAGREFLATRLSIPNDVMEKLGSLGLSSICNVLAAVKTAKHFGMNSSDVVVTVATDGSEMYASEAVKTLASRFHGRFDAIDAAAVFGQHLDAVSTDNLLETTHRDRRRIFNLGYFTWVEQQGVTLEEFEARASQSFWNDLQQWVPAWDAMIGEVNAETSVMAV